MNMSKLDTLQLYQSIGREEFDHLELTSALSNFLAVDQKINELLKSGTIIRIKKGLYAFGPKTRQTPICKESLSNLIYGPSCISMEYALYFHRFIPERVETITSVTPNRNKEFKTPIGNFTYRYLNATKYPHGIEQKWIDNQHPILIASPEKALCDYVVLHEVAPLTTRIEAKLFLKEDLRIDEEQWQRFDLKNLLQLNSHYQSPNIEKLMEVI